MIKRIVRMHFRPYKVADFLEVFDANKKAIRQFEGCQHLELWRSTDEKEVLYTFSFWESEAALEQYRQSELFKSTWALTKPLFASKAIAWSVQMIDVITPGKQAD